MRPRFQGDANFNGGVIGGLMRKDPTISFRTAHEAELKGLQDEKVLLIAADADRILVTHDVKTMPEHFGKFIQKRNSPGVIIIPQSVPIGEAVEVLLMVWFASEHEEYLIRIVVLPY